MSAAPRIYTVKKTFEQSHPVLVKAHSQAQALHHVVRNQYTVAIASALDVADHMTDGYKIEDATAEPVQSKEEE